MNFWPDQSSHFLKTNADFESLGPGMHKLHIPVTTLEIGTFCDESKPLGCIYIPDKYAPSNGALDIEITPLPAAQALIELLRYSFIPPGILEVLGWQDRRLDFFARLVERVPVRRLRYPVGFEHLPRVTEAVLQDLKNLPSQP
jgi:hypothetical protein